MTNRPLKPEVQALLEEARWRLIDSSPASILRAYLQGDLATIEEAWPQIHIGRSTLKEYVKRGIIPSYAHPFGDERATLVHIEQAKEIIHDYKKGDKETREQVLRDRDARQAAMNKTGRDR